MLALPSFAHLAWAFDWSMVVPFAVTGLAAAMSTTAVITTYQRLTDADWVRPDARSIDGGILGDGIAAVAAGLLGTYGLTISTAMSGLCGDRRRRRYIAFAFLDLSPSRHSSRP